MRRFSLIGACLLLGAAAAGADDRDFSGTVRKIFDGDSLLVRPGKGRDVDVRLQDIDAPEKSQPYGNSARAALIKLIGDRDVFVDVVDTDHYGRKVVRVYREPDRLDVAKALVRDGHVWVYRRTVHDRSLIELEEAARAGRRGLWALPEQDRVPPWQYRYKQRQKNKRTSVAEATQQSTANLWHPACSLAAELTFAIAAHQTRCGARASERAQSSRFHQPITPIAASIVVAPRTEGRGEAGADWTIVIPQPVEVTGQLYSQR